MSNHAVLETKCQEKREGLDSNWLQQRNSTWAGARESSWVQAQDSHWMQARD